MCRSRRPPTRRDRGRGGTGGKQSKKIDDSLITNVEVEACMADGNASVSKTSLTACSRTCGGYFVGRDVRRHPSKEFSLQTCRGGSEFQVRWPTPHTLTVPRSGP